MATPIAASKLELEKRDQILTLEINELKSRINVLSNERKELRKQIAEDNVQQLPYLPDPGVLRRRTRNAETRISKAGLYSVHTNPPTALYWNETDKTYYRKPLYRASGTMYGMAVPIKYIAHKEQQLIAEGYVLVD